MGTVVIILVAIVGGYMLFKVGVGMLGSLGTPLPAPPPAGEMRRVNIRYRCSVCGTEMKMLLATDELPEPPRHCLEDMDLVAPIE